MDEIKVAVIGKESEIKSNLIKNITKNSTNVKFSGMPSGIDIGFRVINDKRVYLFGGSAKEKKRFFEEVMPAGIDLGIVVLDSKSGISNKDKQLIRDVKKKNVPCMVFLNDSKEQDFYTFGKSIVHGSADNSKSTSRLLDFLTRVS